MGYPDSNHIALIAGRLADERPEASPPWVKGKRLDTESFELIVNACYAPLYRFAYSLCTAPEDAADLTQEAFRRLAAKAALLRDPSKAKSWLFTTLYRAFLARHRHLAKFPEVEMTDGAPGLPSIPPGMMDQMDAATALAALMKLDAVYRAPLSLFYLEEHSYAEIAEILDIPIGTVMSRIARGKALLREQLAGSPNQVHKPVETAKGGSK